MRAVTYSPGGELVLGELPPPVPGPEEALVRVMVSGVNPTDWKSGGPSPEGEVTVPNHDGAGVVEAIGPGVTSFEIGDRVWTTLAADGRPASGTAQELTAIPVTRLFPLPENADFELGASIGIPGGTAYRALTVADGGPRRHHPHALDGRTVLVAGGAGAVGNAAIQLARWAGATVIATVSGPAKAELATMAGAHLVVDYRAGDAVEKIRDLAPAGVDIIVEVAAAANAQLDLAVLRPRGTIAIYANERGAGFEVDVWRSMGLNARYQFVLLYTVGWDRIAEAAADINLAIAEGGLRVGEDAGLPLHLYDLSQTDDAHEAVRSGAVGKVLVRVGDATGDPA